MKLYQLFLHKNHRHNITYLQSYPAKSVEIQICKELPVTAHVYAPFFWEGKGN